MITFEDIATAHWHIRGQVRRTPTVRFRPLRESLGYEVWLKPENQHVIDDAAMCRAMNVLLERIPISWWSLRERPLWLCYLKRRRVSLEGRSLVSRGKH